MHYHTKTKLYNTSSYIRLDTMNNHSAEPQALIPRLHFSPNDFYGETEPELIHFTWGDGEADMLELHPDDKYDTEKVVLYALVKKFIRMRCKELGITYYNNIPVKLVNKLIKELAHTTVEGNELYKSDKAFEIRTQKRKLKKLQKRAIKEFVKSKTNDTEPKQPKKVIHDYKEKIYTVTEKQLTSIVESVMDKYFTKRKDNILNE